MGNEALGVGVWTATPTYPTSWGIRSRSGLVLGLRLKFVRPPVGPIGRILSACFFTVAFVYPLQLAASRADSG